MSRLQELINNGYTHVVITGNPTLPTGATVVARGQAAQILAHEEDLVKASALTDGVGTGGQVSVLDQPTEIHLESLRSISRQPE